MKFTPYADECTTFENVRILRFYERSLDVIIPCEKGEKIFTNTKSFVLYYNADTSKILNTLQEVKLTSEKLKAKYSLKELVELSDIEKKLKKWVKK